MKFITCLKIQPYLLFFALSGYVIGYYIALWSGRREAEALDIKYWLIFTAQFIIAGACMRYIIEKQKTF